MTENFSIKLLKTSIKTKTENFLKKINLIKNFNNYFLDQKFLRNFCNYINYE